MGAQTAGPQEIHLEDLCDQIYSATNSSRKLKQISQEAQIIDPINILNNHTPSQAESNPIFMADMKQRGNDKSIEDIIENLMEISQKHNRAMILGACEEDADDDKRWDT